MAKKDLRVLLVSLYNDEAYGLRILHSIVNEAGYDARLCFIKLNNKTINTLNNNNITKKEIKLFLNLVKLYRPHIIGFSLVSTNFNVYKKIYKRIRKYTDSKIIVGGWQATLSPKETLNYADVVFIGEGEKPLLEYINNYYKNGIYQSRIKNIWYKRKKQTIKNDVRPLLQDINYPTFRFNNNSTVYIENNELVEQEPYKTNTRYGTMISRGCPFACTYCSNSYLVEKVYNNWCKVRYRDYDKVLDELLQVKNELPSVKSINFYDEVFLPKTDKAKEFFKKYKELINLPFYCMFYPGTCNEELAKMLKEAGLAGVWLGIQSGSERVRNEVFSRFYTNEQILNQANVFKKYDINVRYDFIFDNPFETEKEYQETIQLMKQLPKPCSFNMFSLKYFPNTIITDIALNNKIITKEDIKKQLQNDSQYYLVDKQKEQEILQLIQ